MPRQRRGIRGDVGIAPYAPPTEIPCVTFGRTELSAPTHAYRTRTLSLSCHSEPVLAAKQVPLGCTLAWESAPPVPCLSLWERWPSAARTERANKEGPPSGGPFLSAT